MAKNENTVQVVFSLPAREHELISRIAGLEGRSIEEYALRALRHIADADAGESVGCVMGFGAEQVIFDKDDGLVAELPDTAGGAA